MLVYIVTYITLRIEADTCLLWVNIWNAKS